VSIFVSGKTFLQHSSKLKAMTRKCQARRRTRVLGCAILAAAFHAVGSSFVWIQRGMQCGTQRSTQHMQYPGQLHLPRAGNEDRKTEKAPMRESKTWTTQTHMTHVTEHVRTVRTGHRRITDFASFASWSLLGGALVLWSLGAYTFLTALLKRCAQCHLGVQQCLHLSKMASGSWIF
jgi:hypothetical protein